MNRIILKRILFISTIILSFLFIPSTSFAETLDATDSSEMKLSFQEIWGYVMIGEETSFHPEYPVTDVGYFVNSVNNMSDFTAVPKRSEKFPDYKSRVHIVSSVDSKAQTHLLLDPKLKLRNKIIKQLVNECKDYDGLQIDWELVPKEDDKNFWEFLKILKKKLKGKMLTVAIPARVKTLERDAYDYATLSKIVDKIIVMAYDEHWSTSSPGPIASVAWCKRIADYSKTVIPEEKLVMGCPLYGRAWSDLRWSSQAYRMYKIDGIIKDNKVSNFRKSADGDQSFTYDKKTRITVYYDTVESSAERCKMYADDGISNLAFWRVGYESKGFWERLEIKSPELSAR